MVDTSYGNPIMWTDDHVADMGIWDKVKEATRQYAEWAFAAEYFMLSSKGVKVRKFTPQYIKLFCGRGLPWRTKMVAIGSQKDKRS